ncbi:MAG TPA: beta-ketoacyl-ACP synthase II [Abditibacteriaceae bacterium]|nr:beta-ketoacyl-ACP synthase II [Abditibacteriaceae bacterium]
MKRAIITGIGIVSPLGLGWNTWVNGLRAGTSATRNIMLFDPLHPLSRAGSTASPLACCVAAEVPDFAPQDWMSSRELDRVPRVVPLALAAAHEAITTSCLTKVLDGERQDVHVVVGSGGGGFSFAEEQLQHWFNRDMHSLSPYAISSSIAGMISSEISIAFGLRGRSHTLSNGCTSSTDAMGTALDLIRSGRAKTVITGGADAPITPATVAAFCLMKAVPTKFNDRPQRASRPFDRDRDGFVLGEGAWIFVVEEEAHALARGAKLWAEVAGYGSTCEAYHRVALSQPDEAARAMQSALDDAAVAPETIDYVNLHGTGTQLNDPLETAAVKLALGDHAYQIPMSSTKSQIGHPQGASGAAGIAAALAAMHQGFVPPTINLDHPDARCDLDYVANHAREADVAIALCNCLGFGSKNSALVVKRL